MVTKKQTLIVAWLLLAICGLLITAASVHLVITSHNARNSYDSEHSENEQSLLDEARKLSNDETEYLNTCGTMALHDWLKAKCDSRGEDLVQRYQQLIDRKEKLGK